MPPFSVLSPRPPPLVAARGDREGGLVVTRPALHLLHQPHEAIGVEIKQSNQVFNKSIYRVQRMKLDEVIGWNDSGDRAGDHTRICRRRFLVQWPRGK